MKESYKLIVREQISKLPSNLRAKIPWISSFCSLHNKIDPFPVNSILEWLKDEVDHYVPAVWSPLRSNKLLNEEQVTMLAALENLSDLWCAPAQSTRKNRGISNAGLSSDFESTKCSGCVLARIGGNAQIVTTLGAFFIGRVHSSIWKRSKRIMWIESWIRGALDDNEKEEAIRKMWRFGIELREVRKKATSTDRAYVDEFVEKAQRTEHEAKVPSHRVGSIELPADEDRIADGWLAQTTADEVFNDKEPWQHHPPSQADEPDPNFEQEFGLVADLEADLEASQLFRVPSSVYSRNSELSQPSSHGTESELIGLYQHSTLALPMGGEAGQVAESDGQQGSKGKLSELATWPRHHLSLVTKPRG